ncbi:MAG: Na/Pi cotransporter family protein [Desulfuromonadales bacterium]|nr:Na/Pi cotransporter family protein [Desulfuromonadales bacterium]
MNDQLTWQFANIIEALGGLGLFILGMKSMSDSLQRFVSGRSRALIEKYSSNRVAAALIGTSLSSLLHSGSASAILIIGFVNAGIISLYQSLAVFLGIGVGASLAVQFITFPISSISFPAIFIGTFFRFYFRNRKVVLLGTLLIGIGLIFLGLKIMTSGIMPLSHTILSAKFINYLFSWQIGVVILGALLTFLFQSPSTAIGVIIVMAVGQVITLSDAVVMVMGGNLGIAATAMLASANGTVSARRSAIIYFIMNFVFILLALLLFPYFMKLVTVLSPVSSMSANNGIPRFIANGYTIFNLIMLIIFLPFIGFFARSAPRVILKKQDTDDLSPYPQFIDVKVLNTPQIAMIQARKEIKQMADNASSMFDDLVTLFYNYDTKVERRIAQKEEAIDSLQKQLSEYIVKLSQKMDEPEELSQVSLMIHMVNLIENFADINDSLLKYLKRKKEYNIQFSPEAMNDLKKLAADVERMVLVITDKWEFSENDLTEVNSLNEKIKSKQEIMLNEHITRMQTGECTVQAGFIYSDILTAFSALADHVVSIVSTGKEFK